MLLGVISDTHGRVETARTAAQMLESFDVDAVLHCGDIGSPGIVPLLAAWPTHFVFGNVDYDQELKHVIEEAGQTCHGRFGSFELNSVKIALLHGDDEKKLRQVIAEGKHQLVCHGHTHLTRCEQIGTTLVLNPGALHRAHRHTIAIVDLTQLSAEIIAL